MFIGYHYTFAKLPDVPMHARLADERVGYFTTELLDFTSDVPRVPVERYANRWRLEKKDPAAALSEPKQPIVYWLDRNIPVRYREPIREGILEWNKAFERIGYKDAIHVEVQPDDADFDTSDIRHASVRWQTVAKTSYGAIGPSVVDPRTGEILDADIGIDANNVRVVRNLRHEYLPPRKDAFAAFAEAAQRQCARALGRASCDVRRRGDAGKRVRPVAARSARRPRPRWPRHRQVRRHVPQERDDARGRPYARAAPQLPRVDGLHRGASSPTRRSRPTHGISGSVMEYNPWNLAVTGEKQGEYTMSTLGPYDYWAIEYAYKPIARRQGSGRARRRSPPARASRGSPTRPTRTSPTSPSIRP